MKTISNSLLVGFFSVGAFLVFLGFLVFTGNLSRWGESNERFVLVFDENVFGLNEGGKVTLNGVRIGRVERFFLGDDLEQGPVPVLVEINKKLVHRHRVAVGNELFDADGDFKEDVIPRLVGQLVQESFVTGILYLNLTTEVDNGDLDKSVTELYGYRMLRSKNSIFAELTESINLEKLGKQMSEFVDIATRQLEGLDLKALSDSYVVLAQDLDHLVNAFSQNYSGLGPSLLQTSEAARVSFGKISALNAKVQEILSPESDLRFGAVSALRDVSAMAKSLKSLADLLERNPQALLRGKIIAED